jgi:hypothetical protein
MMHDRLLGRLTCNLLSVTVLDGGLNRICAAEKKFFLGIAEA